MLVEWDTSTEERKVTSRVWNGGVNLNLGCARLADVAGL